MSRIRHQIGSALVEFMIAIAILTVYGFVMLGVVANSASVNQQGGELRNAYQLAHFQLEKVLWLIPDGQGFDALHTIDFAFLDSRKSLVYRSRVDELSPSLKRVTLEVFTSRSASGDPLPKTDKPLTTLATVVARP